MYEVNFMFKGLREFVRSIKARDPAARNAAQILLLYSGVHALIFYRIAHFFYKIQFNNKFVSIHIPSLQLFANTYMA